MNLVLEQFDTALHSLGDDFRIEVPCDELEEFFTRRGTPGEFEELLHGSTVFLARQELASLSGVGNQPWCASSERWVLRCAIESDDWGYRLHDGRELRMMLEGTKPFAFVMLRAPADDPRPPIFARLADEGRLGLRIVANPGYTTFLLATPGEEWRCSAFLLLQEAAAKQGWNPLAERFLGRLLGYSDREIDIYLEKTAR